MTYKIALFSLILVAASAVGNSVLACGPYGDPLVMDLVYGDDEAALEAQKTLRARGDRGVHQFLTVFGWEVEYLLEEQKAGKSLSDYQNRVLEAYQAISGRSADALPADLATSRALQGLDFRARQASAASVAALTS